ncbi:MAG: hypothetical protein JW827_05860 [Spirochaetes bacterium]|nr:hypothetical protein [Spirochaetota bacterium]
MKTILLDFNDLKLKARLFNTEIAKKFYENLPYHVKLISWGEELYGPIGHDLGQENPVPVIPPGGIAYSRQGTYICIFFGQTPAWPVDHIGNITGDGWKKLTGKNIPSVIISKKE